MPGAAIETVPLGGWTRGFFGKLPAHGDFVQAGLPRGFVAAWDGWMSRVLPASRERLGAAWLDAWLEAPVWRFVLPAGMCGEQAAIGVWMPSVDRAGRHFPLVVAACGDGGVAPDDAEVTAFLDMAAEAGMAALEMGSPASELAAALGPILPAALAAALPPAPSRKGRGSFRDAPAVRDELAIQGAPSPCGRGLGGGPRQRATARWWTEGAPLVRAGVRESAALPDDATFASMLSDGARG